MVATIHRTVSHGIVQPQADADGQRPSMLVATPRRKIGISSERWLWRDFSCPLSSPRRRRRIIFPPMKANRPKAIQWSTDSMKERATSPMRAPRSGKANWKKAENESHQQAAAIGHLLRKAVVAETTRVSTQSAKDNNNASTNPITIIYKLLSINYYLLSWHVPPCPSCGGS